MTGVFDDPVGYLRQLLLMAPAILIAVTVHELAHGLVADRLGDPTARRLGRLTLNPLPHIDPLGALAFILAGFGWAKPVPVNAANFHHPVRDMALVAGAGPLSNFLVAFIAPVVLRLAAHAGLVISQGEPLARVLLTVFIFNVAIGVFNLIPLPPLDGGHFLPYLLPRSAWVILPPLHQYGGIILLILVFSGATAWIIGPLRDQVSRLIVMLVRLIV